MFNEYKMKKVNFTHFLLFAFCIFSANWAMGQCSNAQVEVAVTIIPDQYPTETTWELRDGNNILLASGANAVGDTFCVDTIDCLRFTIFDSYGDGICCSFGTGSYTVTYDGTQVAAGGNFTFEETTMFGNCAPGSDCSFADTVTTGAYSASHRNFWYLWIPDSTGTYEISTCGNNNCNTVIWVYDHCVGLQWDNTNQGTAYYNDNDCGLQARVTGHFAVGTPYWIRIGDQGSNCTGAINWTLTYMGPVVGCTDPNACNYNPLATVSDTCYYPGDTLCPDGPDLTVIQSAIEGSLQLDILTQVDPCLVNEGCLTGYGTRDLMRFTTHIKNIGTQDYYIGEPNANPQMFQFDVCHGHWHFAGYAEYVLYDSMAQPLPIGFKNGFCVLDLECSGGGTAQYGCGNMGISTGCGDIYDAGLQCQWIDITTVPSGRYTLVVRVNWNRLPDALGRVEKDFDNNWAQVCFNLVKDPIPGGHNHSFTLDPNCPPLVDCNGVVFGGAVIDCAGVCDGTALRGDVDNNQAQQVLDGNRYVADILSNTPVLTTCTDLNSDGEISVFDAALINACALRGDGFLVTGGGIHDYCSDLPSNVVNIHDSVWLRLGAIDYNNRTLDVEILNPDCRVAAYQFEVSGLNLLSATNLIPSQEFPNPVQVNANGTVIALTTQDSSIGKSVNWRSLCRLNFASVTGGLICLDQIVDVVNSEYEGAISNISGSCITSVAVADIADVYHVRVFPNPFSKRTTLEFDMFAKEKFTLEILDIQGRVVRDYGQVRSNSIDVERGNLGAGIYFYRLKGKAEQVGKLVFEFEFECGVFVRWTQPNFVP